MQQASPSFAPDLARGHLLAQKRLNNLGSVVAVTIMAIVLIVGAQLAWVALYSVTTIGVAFIAVGVLLLIVSAVSNVLLVRRLSTRFPSVRGVMLQGILVGIVAPVIGAFFCIIPVSFAQIEAGSSTSALPISLVVLIVIVFVLPSVQCITLAYNTSSVEQRFGPGAAAQLWHFQLWQLGEQDRFLNAQLQTKMWASGQAHAAPQVTQHHAQQQPQAAPRGE
ncbi:hypothetical protein [Lysinibacter cavernae]|uniref:Uncharacterized protein n=1 Tax=Lysinibacter cavernae TaxID=1640652 RepID=A0A7X5R000_9MICO|nr:hypothetical protein [Lysinibacter cavernae]NIH53007.1 hypothetical protein [Lysinibacter cavernae]